MTFIFKLFKNVCDFCKIIIIFLIVIYLIFWVEHLTHNTFSFLDIFRPLFINITKMGETVTNNGSFMMFEYKYFIGIIILTIAVLIAGLAKEFINKIEELHNKTKKVMSKINQNIINKELQLKQTLEQKQIKQYSIYLKTKLKSKYLNSELKVSLDDENKKILNAIRLKLNTLPSKFENGYVYKFVDFNGIDNVLSALLDVLNEQRKIDYALSISIDNDEELSKKIYNLDFYGKIVFPANVGYRYTFNKSQQFSISQIGIFQNNDGEFELNEMTKNE